MSVFFNAECKKSIHEECFLPYYSAADHVISVVKNERLTCRNCSDRLFEFGVKSVFVCLPHLSPLLLVGISCPGLDTDGGVDTVAGDKVYVCGVRISGEQLFVTAEDDSVIFYILFLYVHRCRQSKSETASLSYGVADDALMCA